MGGGQHHLTACICCAGVPAWASPHFASASTLRQNVIYTRTLGEIGAEAAINRFKAVGAFVFRISDRVVGY